MAAPAHPLRGGNPFKLGLFATNADGGLTLTRAAERWPALWPEIVETARMADEAGLDFVLPIARWKGFGGATNSRQRSFETLTFATGLAAATRRIAVLATVHVPMVHPVFAAKALATLDHVAQGRAGLNIVCGWNPQEFALFGLPMIDNRYEQGREWFEIVRRIHAGETFDFEGAFYALADVSGEPRPVQEPGIVTLNAAFSPPGRDFAATAADYLLTTFTTIEKGAEHVADMEARAAAQGRRVAVMATCHVVCRPSREEAERDYRRYAVEEADTVGLDHYMGAKESFSGSHEADAYRLHRQRFAGGAGTYPLVGTPTDIADEMVAMREAGFAGTTVSFLNFKDELPFFLDGVLPRLARAGLRLA